MPKATSLPALILATSLLLPSCGSDTSSVPELDEPMSELAPQMARVTVGPTTWTSTATVCANFGGSALGFTGQADGDPSISITLDAVPADPPSNSARIDVSDGVSWRAGEPFLDLGGTIPIVTAESGYGSGTATFVNTLDPNGPVTGTYETASGEYEFNCR